MIKSLIFVVTSLITCWVNGSEAPKTDESIDWKKLEPIIEAAYREHANAFFASFASEASKAKLASDLVISFNKSRLTTDDQKKIRELLGSAPSPKILTIRDGLELNGQGQKWTVTLTKKMGEIDFNGQVRSGFLPPGTSFIDHVQRQKSGASFLWNVLENKAHAQVGLGWALKLTLETTLGYGAMGAAEGALLGCLGGAYYHTREQTYLEGCTQSAKTMGAVTGGAGSGVGALTGTSIAVVPEIVWLVKTAGPPAFKAAAGSTLRLSPALAFALALPSALKTIYANEGVGVYCYGTSSTDGFSAEMLHLGKPAFDRKFQYQDGYLNLRGVRVKATEEDLFDYLKKRSDFSKLNEEYLHILSKGVLNEVESIRRRCQDEPAFKEYHEGLKRVVKPEPAAE